MAAITAEVEVLTAEVRVLMVGNRQVTLSVYRQLDRVAPPDCEPFGRVSDKTSRQSAEGVQVVGKHRDTGALVACEMRSQPSQTYLGPQDVITDAEWADWCRRRDWKWRGGNTWQSPGLQTVTLLPRDGLRVIGDITPDKFEQIVEELPHGGSRPIGWRGIWKPEPTGLPNEALDELVDEAAGRAWRRLHREHCRYDEWADLPLIVLAGLR